MVSPSIVEKGEEIAPQWMKDQLLRVDLQETHRAAS
jgi:hypothetical protein